MDGVTDGQRESGSRDKKVCSYEGEKVRLLFFDSSVLIFLIATISVLVSRIGNHAWLTALS